MKETKTNEIHNEYDCILKGSFTDFNVWDSFLSEADMEDFTRCKYMFNYLTHCFELGTMLGTQVPSIGTMLGLTQCCFEGQTWSETFCPGMEMTGR